MPVDYEEETDGFRYTRTRSKRIKDAAAAQESKAIPETIQEEPRAPPSKKTRRKTDSSPSPPAAQKDSQPEKRRRSPRNSGENIEAEPPPIQVKKRRKGKEPSTPAPESRPDDQQPEAQPTVTNDAPSFQNESIQNEEVTKVALPFADTPIIRRNQEMRANSGQRRSSLGNRGRRASSLIDSGKSNGKEATEHA